MSGASSYHGGLAAEDQVAAHYERQGLSLAARRWRGTAGEIDLILRDGAALVFVEVKKASSTGDAAWRLGPAQVRRICDAASEFVGGEPAGQDTEMRFDLALVGGAGEIEIIENAFGA